MGIKTIEEKETIVERLNRFLNSDISNHLKSFKTLYDMLYLKFIKNENRDKTIPILTNINILKPLIKEEINKEKSIFNENYESLELEIFKSEFLNDPELKRLVLNQPEKMKINDLSLVFGSIHVQSTLISKKSNISNNKKTNYFYNRVKNILYLDEKIDSIYSSLEKIFGFDTNSLNNIFNKIISKRNSEKINQKNEEFESILKDFSKFRINDKSRMFYEISFEKNQIATIMHNNHKYDEAFKYCNKSIMYAIKSILEYEKTSYGTSDDINRLKRLTNCFNEQRELTSFETNLNQFKTSLCKHSNEENSLALLLVSNEYLQKANFIINQ
ncbi:hypothetical protein DICPUDRAFT_151962 [Dictyostelium purpureum]|uniref:Uncharacterized protein n=1 Tax=Dictyostelium purpureum TaxID=5786 RepID=F0ZK55_DICPU|nr:uncharacterized protein DICPUDRAFT_151962 [Dictyostelium purpureum]EGC35671.1 hypothetical protein DICPUDRAFT_151962 [Dictyostelium purpureum]|eukprot:XP_003287804.1 hypothetical protein DICPUDRAFT_151962 [Dictyostelium purpureum]